jgi:hypothetical protein
MTPHQFLCFIAPYPMASNPLAISISQVGVAQINTSSTVTIGAGRASVTWSVTPTIAGKVQIVASANGFNSAQIYLTVQTDSVNAIQINKLLPNKSKPESLIKIQGQGFVSPDSANTVVFAGQASATVISGTATELTVKVPTNAQTGVVTVSNERGGCYLLISDRIFYLFSIITKSKNQGVFTTFAS